MALEGAKLKITLTLKMRYHLTSSDLDYYTLVGVALREARV